MQINSGTVSPISLDQMKLLSEVVDVFPADYFMQVQATALEIYEFATSSDPAKNLAVADADEIKTVGGSPITVEQLDVVRSIDDVKLEAGTIDISDGASAIIAANDASLNSAEIGTVTVHGAPVTASTGATLNGMTKAVVYDVEDQENIYDNYANLDEATNIVVVSGG